MTTVQTWEQDEYSISTDRERLDIQMIHAFLSTSYWATGIPLETVRHSLENSLAFGVYHGQRQIGLARVVSDYTTFAYIADVFIIEEYRGRGLSKWLMEIVTAHPDLQGLRRWILMTRDAHGLYEKVGFTLTRTPERVMERIFPDIYLKREMVEQEGTH